VIDAELLTCGRHRLVAANAQEEAQIIPLKAAITVSHNVLPAISNI
jgi:hypothetical protein